MSVLSDNYKKIISEIETQITNPEELEFVKQKISELSMMFMDIIDNLANTADEKIKQIEDKQKEIETKMSKVENTVNEIESDIYTGEEEFDFEIVCPYCNYEFEAEINGKNEIVCPECNNVIELDWNEEDEGCSGHCSSCHGCEEDDFEEEKEEDNNQEENEDDM